MKAYYNQEKIASSLRNFFKKFSISKPLLKNLCYIILAMISAESVVTSDFSRKLKDNFSLIHLESIERRFRRFFNSFSSISYSLFETFIKPISQSSKILTDVFFTRKLFKTNIVVPTYTNHSNSDIWYIVTNDDPHRATKNYSYRFGSIECIFKSQKSNGFRLESTNT